MATRRTIDDRLFEPEYFSGGWSISIQADYAGYQCSPQRRLDTLEQYDAVEVVIYGPEHWAVDPTTMGLPENIAQKFTEVDVGCPSIGCHITHEELAVIRDVISKVMMHPNAGVPRGNVVWQGADVWHGTGAAAAEDIRDNGIDMSQSNKGYFGQAFYVADNRNLAQSNYADFAEEEGIEEPGRVVYLYIDDASRILDLRNPVDAEIWSTSGLASKCGQDGFAGIAVKAGIDGVYDRSVGGLAIYNPTVLKVCRVEPTKEDEPSVPKVN